VHELQGIQRLGVRSFCLAAFPLDLLREILQTSQGEKVRKAEDRTIWREELEIKMVFRVLAEHDPRSPKEEFLPDTSFIREFELDIQDWHCKRALGAVDRLRGSSSIFRRPIESQERGLEVVEIQGSKHGKKALESLHPVLKI
jgi:hypothetical protein